MLDAIRRSEYVEAIDEANRINLESLSDRQRSELLDAMRLAGSTIRGRPRDKIRAYEQLIRIGHLMVENNPDNALVKELIAEALIRKATSLMSMRRIPEGLAIYDELVRLYGEETEPTLQVLVARAILNKATRLSLGNENAEGVSACDDVLRRYGSSNDERLQPQIGRAMYHKILYLKRLGYDEKAIDVANDLVARFDRSKNEMLQGFVANALFQKASALVNTRNTPEAIQSLDQIIACADVGTAEMADYLGRAMMLKANLYTEEKRLEDALQVYDGLIERSALSEEPLLASYRASAMVAKGQIQRLLGRTEDAIGTFDAVCLEYSKDAEVIEHVASALLHKAEAMADLGLEDGAASLCVLISDRYGSKRECIDAVSGAKELAQKLAQSPTRDQTVAFRQFIRERRGALAGFMEQGATLNLNGDILTVTPRNDIYIRYLNDNRASLKELASEFYQRPIKVEVVLEAPTASRPTELRGPIMTKTPT